MRLTNIFHLGLKELVSLRHDMVLMLLIAYSFTIAIVAPAKGVRLELQNASIAVVDEDRSTLSRRLIDGLHAPFFQPPQLVSLAEVDSGMDAGHYTFVLDIPPDFQADLTAGRRPQVQLNVDATAMAQAGSGARYIEQMIDQEARIFVTGHPRASPLPVSLVTHLTFNPNSESSWFLAVMQIANMCTLLGILLTGAALIREREHGTIEHLLVMPLTPAEIMLAKVWSNALVILAAATVALLLVVHGFLEVPIAGSVPLFMLGLAVYLFALTAIGILLATLARSMPQFGLLSIPVFLVMYMLSGANTPLEAMPEILQKIVLASPTTHFVSFSQGVIFRGAGITQLWSQLLTTGAIGAIAFIAALFRFRRTVSLTHL